MASACLDLRSEIQQAVDNAILLHCQNKVSYKQSSQKQK